MLERWLGAGWKARWKRWWRPPRELKITRFGWFFLVITVGVGVAAINTENNLLYLMLGLLLALITASGSLSEMVLRELDWEVSLPPDPVAGHPFYCEIRVHNTKRRLPSFAVETEIRAQGRKTVARAFFFKVGAGESASRTAVGFWPRRGRVELADVRFSTRFPFGLFEKGRIGDYGENLIVLPDSTGDLADLPFPPSILGTESAGIPGQGADLFALRPWESGDSARRIHWRKSAGPGGLQSKVYEQESRPEITLALVEGGALTLDDAVTRAARMLARLDEQGIRVGLAAGETYPPAEGRAHRLALMRALALYHGQAPAALTGSEVVIGFRRN